VIPVPDVPGNASAECNAQAQVQALVCELVLAQQALANLSSESAEVQENLGTKAGGVCRAYRGRARCGQRSPRLATVQHERGADALMRHPVFLAPHSCWDAFSEWESFASWE
jgi:hypothetical protein